MKVAIIFGSRSDSEVMKGAAKALREFNIEFEAFILSAHRVPEQLEKTLIKLENENCECVIAGAGLAAHLPGVIASKTIIPVVGVPINAALNGLDALLSIVQMPKSIPVATVGINNSYNAGMLAVEMLSLKYPEIRKKLIEYRETMKKNFIEENEKGFIMEKKEMIYEGKAKKVYSTEDKDKVIIYYKDDATAFNGVKKGQIEDKGVLNNAITSSLFTLLEQKGIKTHFEKKLNEREQLCKKVEIVPLEVIVRNIAAGSMSKRLGVEEGTELKTTVFEISYKNDDLGDPLINDYHAVAIGLTTFEELKKIYAMASKINDILKEFFIKENIKLVDFKLEFGRFNGEIILADEISPDTCRFWDAKTNEKLDKDRFRRDLGNVKEAYIEILNRINEGK